ncbi:heavy-metal-associated domain-containing protein [Mycobacterium sp. TNTM28]|uniref:Heavy-metal-associated domain-containing protein n=2 Tax=[Mycobacterium] fortunisiensis TaxID=2600579 RepID=A0ABS6KQS8_9MYCO|nr:heavy-metal-associated domain-containing protein [[Mycobacterium] fortunisiensis]
MSCGACSSRVEKKLNSIDGVRASVDIATKIATVDTHDGVTVAELCAAVEQAGYRAAERTTAAPDRPQPSALTRLVGRLSFGHLGG